MIRQVNIGSPTAISDPYSEAQRAQEYADALQRRAQTPQNYGTATTGQSVAMGLTQLAEALLARNSQGYAAQKLGEADAATRSANESKLDALYPTIKGQQVPTGVTLDALSPTDAPATLRQSAAIPEQMDPHREMLKAAMEGVDPRVAGGTLSAAMLRQAMPEPKPVGYHEVSKGGILVDDTGKVIARGEADKEAAAKPLDETGKINEDFKNGFIDQKTRDARLKNVTRPIGAGGAPEMQLVEVPQKDGTVQKEWVPKGATSGVHVGEPTQPTTGMGGSRMASFTQRIITGGELATKAVANVVKMPAGATTGVLGLGAHQGQSLFSIGAGALKNGWSSQEVQSYKVLTAGIQRNLSAIEASGLAPPGSLTASMDNIIYQPNDTQFTKLQKLAESRQIVEYGLGAVLNNPYVTEEQKKQITTIISDMKKAVPFTNDDVTTLIASNDPKLTMNDVIKKNGLGGAGKSYGSVAEAEAAGHKAGDRVVINGVSGTLK